MSGRLPQLTAGGGRSQGNRRLNRRWQTSEATSKMQGHRRLLPAGKEQAEWQVIFGFFYFSASFLIALRQTLGSPGAAKFLSLCLTSSV